ncbi:MAG: sulfotransferase family 2 domain-containing protein [Pseudomonadota bacterium]
MSAEPAAPADAPARTYVDLLASRRFPIFCKPIQKAGCTTLKCVFHHLDHGRWPDRPAEIHRRQRELLRFTDYDVTAEDVAAGGAGFAVVRKPLDRLLSFYFDKLAAFADRPAGMPWLAARLAERYGLDPSPDLDVETHRRNLFRTLDFIADNAAGRTLEGRNPHWTPQSYVLRNIGDAKLTHIPLERMAEGVERLVGQLAPGIGDLIRAAPRFNETKWSDRVDRDALIARPLLQQVRKLFREDYRIYRAAVAAHEERAP